RSFADLLEVDDMVRQVNDAAPDSSASGTTDDHAATATGGHTALDGQLELVARCIEAKVATRVFSVSLGGFDTHADEKTPQLGQLTKLDTALSAFAKRVAGK